VGKRGSGKAGKWESREVGKPGSGEAQVREHLIPSECRRTRDLLDVLGYSE